MLLHQRFIPGLAIASYIVGDEKSGEAAVIDPTRDVDEYIDYARDGGGGQLRPHSQTHRLNTTLGGSPRFRQELLFP